MLFPEKEIMQLKNIKIRDHNHKPFRKVPRIHIYKTILSQNL